MNFTRRSYSFNWFILPCLLIVLLYLSIDVGKYAALVFGLDVEQVLTTSENDRYNLWIRPVIIIIELLFHASVVFTIGRLYRIGYNSHKKRFFYCCFGSYSYFMLYI